VYMRKLWPTFVVFSVACTNPTENLSQEPSWQQQRGPDRAAADPENHPADAQKTSPGASVPRTEGRSSSGPPPSAAYGTGAAHSAPGSASSLPPRALPPGVPPPRRQGDLVNIPPNPHQEAIDRAMQQADQALAARDYQKALTALQAVEKLDPDNHGLFDKRSRVYYNTGDWEACARDCTRAINLITAMDSQGVHTTALSRRGAALMNLKRCDEAIADFDVVIKHRPDFGFAYYDRGRCYRQKGRLHDAKADFETVLRLGDAAPDILRRTKGFLAELKNLQE